MTVPSPVAQVLKVCAIVLIWAWQPVDAFSPLLPVARETVRRSLRPRMQPAGWVDGEFDHLLGGEGDIGAMKVATAANSATTTLSSSRQRRHYVVLPSSANPSSERDQKRVLLMSSTLKSPSAVMTETQDDEDMSEDSLYGDGKSSFQSQQESSELAAGGAAPLEEADPYADALESQFGKIQQLQDKEQSPRGAAALTNRLKEMDFQELVVTLVIPSLLAFVAGRWGYNRIADRVKNKADTILESFAKEMVYHDGDFREMDLCIKDYSRRLVWLGPAKTDTMLKRYLEMYAKKKTVSPQAIASLSYVFTAFRLSEEKAANVLVSLCRDMGTERISSAGKLLFFGSRILKSAEGAKALEPIKTMIKSTYRDATVAETLIETSQQAIAEASYRAAVQAGGKKQRSLTVGWEVLGLERETAERIFSEEAEAGFVTDRETMYGLQTQKYDKKGRRIDKEGKVLDPSEADQDDDDSEGPSSDDDGPVSNVYECGECGYTLFVAKGREAKFFGDSFRCPDCGAPKDKFKARDDLE